MKYKIAFVIPVHNRLEYNKECLQILEKQKETLFFSSNDIEIIVVDDGSTDGTGEWIRENRKDVIVLQGDGNLWYSGSMNLGMKYAIENFDSDFIMVWENDIFPVDDYFNQLQYILNDWDGKTLICSKLYYRVQPDKIFGMGGTFDIKTGRKSLIGRTQTDGPEYQKDIEVDWFLGQGVLIHKDIISKVGYLDEKNFPQYHADVDYSLRAKEAGYTNMVFQKLKLLNDTEMTGISHLKNKSLKQFFESLTSIRSNTNLAKDIIFYRIHTKGITAYQVLIKKYVTYIGSYFKWTFLGWFGMRRKNEDLL
ncbi:MAG: glycosyltransferase family 2 protein [Bacteroidota bacterium]